MKSTKVASHHQTALGRYIVGNCETLLRHVELEELRGQVQLIFTSPPFPLQKKKRYGNRSGDEFSNWLVSLAKVFSNLLTADGSIVIEMGNAWEKQRPVQSLLSLQTLMGFVQHPEAALVLCQEFIAYNPSRLPSPANWVTIERIRATDSYTRLWWMAKTDRPKADNRKVLRPYSKSMKSLLKRQKFNAGLRPSGHTISESGFLQDNGGSISHNFFEIEPMEPGSEPRPPNAFSLANTSSNDYFMQKCAEIGIKPHPARMPAGLAAFFIQFLTDENDLVLDPFAGSNTTGYVAERLGRRWVSIEAKREYAEQSRIRMAELGRQPDCGEFGLDQ